jgi:hypothetical protein
VSRLYTEAFLKSSFPSRQLNLRWINWLYMRIWNAELTVQWELPNCCSVGGKHVGMGQVRGADKQNKIRGQLHYKKRRDEESQWRCVFMDQRQSSSSCHTSSLSAPKEYIWTHVWLLWEKLKSQILLVFFSRWSASYRRDLAVGWVRREI